MRRDRNLRVSDRPWVNLLGGQLGWKPSKLECGGSKRWSESRMRKGEVPKDLQLGAMNSPKAKARVADRDRGQGPWKRGPPGNEKPQGTL